MKRAVIGLLILVLVASLALVATVLPASAAPLQTQTTCPEGGGWVKVDDLDGFAYTYTPPAGYTVTDNCYKHSTYVHYGSGPTVTADWHALTRFPWFRRYELSHASFLIEPIFTVTPTLTVTVTIE